MTALGIDVGGTKLAAVAVDPDGTVLHRLWREHEIRSASALVDAVADAVSALGDELAAAGRDAPSRVGLGVAAWLSPDCETIEWAAHFKIRDFRIREALEARLGLPVRVDNDGNAQGLGEFRFGAGSEVDSLLLLSLGTGVGGALVFDGRPYRGAHGFAGELGHVSLLDDGPICSCEAHGCLEAFAGGQALARIAGTMPAPTALAAGRPVTAKHLVDAAKAGDAASMGIIGDVGIVIAAALRRLLPAFDPAIVVLGGSIGINAHQWILPIAEAELERMSPLQSVPQPRRLAPAALGAWATAIGAAALVL